MLTQIVREKKEVLPLTIEIKCYIIVKKTHWILSDPRIDELQQIKYFSFSELTRY